MEILSISHTYDDAKGIQGFNLHTCSEFNKLKLKYDKLYYLYYWFDENKNLTGLFTYADGKHIYTFNKSTNFELKITDLLFNKNNIQKWLINYILGITSKFK